MTIHKGVISGFRGSRDSGIGFLVISGVPVPCDNAPCVRALQACFGGFIGEDHTVNNEAIKGKEIYYSVDVAGLLEAFTPTDEAPGDLVQDYKLQEKLPRRRKTKRDN